MPELITSLIASAVASLYVGYRLLLPNEFLPWYTRLFGIFKPSYPIRGDVKKGYESVEKVFRKHFEMGREVGASCVVMVGEEKMVDLFGGFEDYGKGKLFDEETLTIVFSSSKFMASVAVARLVDQGHLDYDAKVCSIWPQFAKNGKENVTVADVLRHEGGLGYFDDPQPTVEDVYDPVKLCKALENQPHNFDGKNVRYYHGVTRGFILNEIVRRSHPKNRTIGQIYKEEINPQIDIEFYLGLDSDLLERRSIFYDLPMIDMLSIIFLPKWLLGAKASKADFSAFTKDAPFNKMSKLKFSHKYDLANAMDILTTEIPSAVGFSSARSICKAAAFFANQGSISGTKLISKSGVLASISQPITNFDICINLNTTFTKGGFCRFEIPGLEEELSKIDLYGWAGMGGSFVVFNPEYKFSFAYVMNASHLEMLGEGRAFNLLHEALKALVSSKSSNSATKIY